MATAQPGMKPTPDGTFKKAGEFLPEYVLEMQNGAKAIVRTYGGNCFSYVTSEGVQVMGVRKDAADIKSDSKPYAGGAPHCFPQVCNINIYVELDFYSTLLLLTRTFIHI